MDKKLIELIENLREDILTNRKELKQSIEASETRLLMKLEALTKRIAKVEEENEQLQRKIEYLERGAKKNNILIFGLNLDHTITFNDIKDSINNLLGVEVTPQDINNYYQLNFSKSKPIKIEFVSYMKKLEILNKCKLLKGTKINIVNDLTQVQREENYILRQHLKKFRENTDTRSYIKGNKLYVNNKAFTAAELLAREEEEDQEIIPRKQNSAPATPTIQATHQQSISSILQPQNQKKEINKQKQEDKLQLDKKDEKTPTTRITTEKGAEPKVKRHIESLKNRTRSGSKS